MNYLLIEVPHQRAAEVTEMTEAEILTYAREGSGETAIETIEDARICLGRDLSGCDIVSVAEASEWAEGYQGHQNTLVRALVHAALHESRIVEYSTPAEVLADLREALGLSTQTDLAEALGVSQTTVSVWLSGGQAMSLPVRKLAWALIR